MRYGLYFWIVWRVKRTDYFQEDFHNWLRNRTSTPRKRKMAVNCILRAAAMKLKGKINGWRKYYITFVLCYASEIHSNRKQKLSEPRGKHWYGGLVLWCIRINLGACWWAFRLSHSLHQSEQAEQKCHVDFLVLIYYTTFSFKHYWCCHSEVVYRKLHFRFTIGCMTLRNSLFAALYCIYW